MPGRAFSNGFGQGFGGSHVKGYLQLVVGSHPTYQDGDIMSAVPWVAVLRMHAHRICHPWLATPVADGLRPSNTHVQQYFERTHEFRFERIGAEMLRRTNLFTAEVVEYGTSVPAPDGGICNVGLYVQRRYAERAPDGGIRLAIFGIKGAEVWYGGTIDESHAKMDLVWSDIETHTPERQANITEAPFCDYRKRLVIAVDNMTDEEAGQLTSPKLDLTDPNNPITVSKRARYVQWRGLRDVVEADVLDKQKVVRMDLVRLHVRSEIVQVKS